MPNRAPLCLVLLAITGLTACTPPPPIPYDGLQDVSAKAVTVILGMPVAGASDTDGTVTWRRETVERYQTPRRIFYQGRWVFDGFDIQEYGVTCDLVAVVAAGRIVSASLAGPSRACDAVRADGARITALVEVLKEDAGTKEPE